MNFSSMTIKIEAHSRPRPLLTKTAKESSYLHYAKWASQIIPVKSLIVRTTFVESWMD